MAVYSFLLILLMEILKATPGVSSQPSGGGCEDGWLHYGYYCYYMGVRPDGTSYQQSLDDCHAMGGRLASVWTSGERTFVTDVLWQPCVTAEQFAWFGLRGTESNTWVYDDQSDVIISDGVLTSSGGEPADKESKCGAFAGSGSLAFLDCTGIQAQGFICKKALSRVFATSDLLNYTLSDLSPPPSRGAQLFERVWPPLLVNFPNSDDYLAEDDADSETGCAFRCYHLNDCKAFLVTCITSDMCKTVSCTFYK